MRTVTASMTTALTAETGSVCHLFELDFSSGTIYLTTAVHDISWSGNTYVALGGHLSYEAVQESADLDGAGVQVTLDGVDQTIIALVLGQEYIGRTARIHQVHFGADGAIVADPVLLFQGLLNADWQIDEDPDPNQATCTVRTTMISELSKFRERRGLQSDTESAQRHYSGDTFWRHQPPVARNFVYWGMEPPDSD